MKLLPGGTSAAAMAQDHLRFGEPEEPVPASPVPVSDPREPVLDTKGPR